MAVPFRGGFPGLEPGPGARAWSPGPGNGTRRDPSVAGGLAGARPPRSPPSSPPCGYFAQHGPWGKTGVVDWGGLPAPRFQGWDPGTEIPGPGIRARTWGRQDGWKQLGLCEAYRPACSPPKAPQLACSHAHALHRRPQQRALNPPSATGKRGTDPSFAFRILTLSLRSDGNWPRRPTPLSAGRVRAEGKGAPSVSFRNLKVGPLTRLAAGRSQVWVIRSVGRKMAQVAATKPLPPNKVETIGTDPCTIQAARREPTFRPGPLGYPSPRSR